MPLWDWLCLAGLKNKKLCQGLLGCPGEVSLASWELCSPWGICPHRNGC